MAVIQGIDVAKWQGTIDWKKVKNSGKKFAILKVTQKNNSVEGKFEANYSGCTENGIPVGVYRYVYAQNTDEAKKEANAIVSVLKGKEISCGVWIDMEDSSISGLGKDKLENIINAEAEILKSAGYKVGIYCNKNWYDNILDGKELSKTYPFWIARYPSNDTGTYNADSSLSPKDYAVVWQYSSKGKVDGISGNVDLDVAFKDLTELMGKIESKPAEKPVSAAKTVNYKVKINTASGVNVRKGPGEKYSKITAIANGKTVTITKEQDSWGYTKEYKGWICLKYTKKVTTSTTTSSTKKDNDIAELQRECNKQGFSNQKVDGTPGPNTLAGCPTVKKGAKGNITKWIQKRLISIGYSCGSSGVDGDFGSGTEKAVKNFQKANGLTADGIVGKDTWKKLLGM